MRRGTENLLKQVGKEHAINSNRMNWHKYIKLQFNKNRKIYLFYNLSNETTSSDANNTNMGKINNNGLLPLRSVMKYQILYTANNPASYKLN